MDPSGSTASSPATNIRIVPCRKTWVPPAFVEIRPPIVADPFPPKVKGKRLPTFAAASCKFCRITPASHVTKPSSASIAVMLFIRRRERISCCPLLSGVAPATMPLFPPCGTSEILCLAASFITAETSCVLAGESRAGDDPVKRPRQSVSQGEMTSFSSE